MPTAQEVREVIKRLHKDGWTDAGIKGDHKKLQRGQETVIVPIARKELKLGTYRPIAKKAGWI